MLDDGGDVEGIVVVKEVDQRWVNSRWGSESVRHSDGVQGSLSAEFMKGMVY